MWQRLKMLWQIWTIDRPAQLGDALWDLLVVQFAAWLDRLTLRKMIALIPLVILLLAYGHNIPIPPEFMLVGDVMAYLDIFSVLLLVGILSRVSTILFVVKQAIAGAVQVMLAASDHLRRLDIRHRRASDKTRRTRANKADDDGCPAIRGVAWA